MPSQKINTSTLKMCCLFFEASLPTRRKLQVYVSGGMVYQWNMDNGSMDGIYVTRNPPTPPRGSAPEKQNIAQCTPSVTCGTERLKRFLALRASAANALNAFLG